MSDLRHRSFHKKENLQGMEDLTGKKHSPPLPVSLCVGFEMQMMFAGRSLCLETFKVYPVFNELLSMYSHN